MRFIRSIRFLALAAAFAAAACSDTNGGPLTKSVAAVEVIPGNRSMQVGETYTFQGRVLDDDGDIIGGRTVTWVSSNPAVATVAFDGIVKAIAPGVAVIAAAADTKIGTSQLTVTSGAVASIEITPGFPMLIVGETQQLAAVAKDADGRPVTAAQIAWATDDASIAEVDQTGRVTAKAKGSAVISAKIGTIVGVSHATVNNVPVAVVLVSPTAIVLQTAQTRQLTAFLRDAKGNALTGRIVNWSSDEPGVATVSATGLITATAPGYATILAASEGVTFGVGLTVIEDDVAFDLLYDRTATNGDRQIFTLNPATGAAPIVLNAGTVSREPSPSPTGDRYAFAVSMLDFGTTKRVDDIFAVNRNGMNMKQLTNAAGTEDHPAWSPIGNRIAYRHIEVQGTRTDIWAMNVDGSAQTNLTADMSPGWMVGAPAWSADGQRIAFSASLTGVAGTTHGIWVMDAGGGNKEMLTNTLTGFDASPTWSPDGTRIGFVRFYAGDADISFVGSAGGAVSRIPIDGNQAAPAWSPDGALIAFAQQVGGRNLIYTVKPNGTDVRLRTNPIFGGGSEPAWITR
jgi:Tol biopolymer transport system component